eukprot:GAHX01002225.1.p1 GENE.GAHX01002225.1~~GAHX01002225.1.p1  ORF type:complete len:258 (+),score=48.13 GAHX01002225.1:78-851(+)
MKVENTPLLTRIKSNTNTQDLCEYFNNTHNFNVEGRFLITATSVLYKDEPVTLLLFNDKLYMTTYLRKDPSLWFTHKILKVLNIEEDYVFTVNKPSISLDLLFNTEDVSIKFTTPELLEQFLKFLAFQKEYVETPEEYPGLATYDPNFAFQKNKSNDTLFRTNIDVYNKIEQEKITKLKEKVLENGFKPNIYKPNDPPYDPAVVSTFSLDVPSLNPSELRMYMELTFKCQRCEKTIKYYDESMVENLICECGYEIIG